MRRVAVRPGSTGKGPIFNQAYRVRSMPRDERKSRILIFYSKNKQFKRQEPKIRRQKSMDWSLLKHLQSYQ